MEQLGRERDSGKKKLLKTSKELSLVIRRNRRYQRHQKKQIIQRPSPIETERIE